MSTKMADKLAASVRGAKQLNEPKDAPAKVERAPKAEAVAPVVTPEIPVVIMSSRVWPD